VSADVVKQRAKLVYEAWQLAKKQKATYLQRGTCFKVSTTSWSSALLAAASSLKATESNTTHNATTDSSGKWTFVFCRLVSVSADDTGNDVLQSFASEDEDGMSELQLQLAAASSSDVPLEQLHFSLTSMLNIGKSTFISLCE
jgi:hypothetical protein